MAGVARIVAGESIEGFGIGGGMANVEAGESFEGTGYGGGVALLVVGTFPQAMNGAYVRGGDFIEGSGQGTAFFEGAFITADMGWLEGAGFGGGAAFIRGGDFATGSGAGTQLPNGRALLTVGDFIEGSGSGTRTVRGLAEILAGEFPDGAGVGGGMAALSVGGFAEGVGAAVTSIPGSAILRVGTFPVGSGAGILGGVRGIAELEVGTFPEGGTGGFGFAEVIAGDFIEGLGRGLVSGAGVEAFRGYGMNLTNRAFWELDEAACSFFEMGRFAGMVIALIPGVGIVRLGPRTAQGLPLEASLKFKAMDMGDEHIKRNTQALVTWRGDTDMQLGTIHDETPHRDYIIRGQVGFTTLRTRRVKLAQGKKSKFIAYRFKNVAGGRFDLHHVELPIEVLERRLP